MKENKKTPKEETSKTMSSDVEKVKGGQQPPTQQTNAQPGKRRGNEEEEAEKGHA